MPYLYSITLKDLKVFLPKINCKMSTSKLRDMFTLVDTRKSSEIGFDDFAILFHQLLHDSTVRHRLSIRITVACCIQKTCQILLIVTVQRIYFNSQVFESLLRNYSSDGNRVTLNEFHSFLQLEQKESISSDQVSKFIRDYLQEPGRDVHEPYLTNVEVSRITHITPYQVFHIGIRNTLCDPIA